ncbi:MAG: hypothetical protein IPK60_09820 [Sandaracinaceae bacterium]|nr:hypothetical protein [Sandaracinaceae bacterium]
MKYRVTLDGKEREVDVSIAPGGSVHVSLDGKAIEVDVVRVDGGINLRIDGHVYDIAAGGKAEALNVASRENRSVATVQSERTRSQKRDGAGAGSGAREVRTPMPGRVVKILVNVGDDVPAKSPVIVVEAMKMENELRTATGGIVESIHVKAGDTVEGNALLIRFK